MRLEVGIWRPSALAMRLRPVDGNVWISKDGEKMKFLKMMLSVLLSLAAASPALAASAVHKRTPPVRDGAYFAQKQADETAGLRKVLGDSGASAQLAALDGACMDNIVETMAPYSPYEFEGVSLFFRAAHEPGEEAKNMFPSGAASVVRQALSVRSRALIPDENTRMAVFMDMSSAQQWTLLRGMEACQEHSSAAGFAAFMLESEEDESRQGLLNLVIARNRWLSRVGVDPAQDENLKIAMHSDDEEVAAQAALWLEALTGPTSYEGALVCHKIWQAVHHDMMNMNRSSDLSAMMCASLPILLNDCRGGDSEAMGRRAELLAIISEAAYQQLNPGLIDYCARQAESLDISISEDVLLPAYFEGAFAEYNRDYETAAGKFEKAYLRSGYGERSMDLGLRAGLCMEKSGKYLEALSMYDTIVEVYGEEGKAARRSENHVKTISKLAPSITSEQIKEYASLHYGRAVERMVAQKENAQDGRALAEKQRNPINVALLAQ